MSSFRGTFSKLGVHVMESTSLSCFDISTETLNKLRESGVDSLYKVQSETYSHIKNGDDVITLAKTGSGKTLAFSIPIIELIQSDNTQRKYGRLPCAIILAPTRELVTQTATVLSSIASKKLIVLSVYGGVPYQMQIKALRAGTDIIVGTPGRIIDLMSSNQLKLDDIRYVVLDEVDRMLDMGFSADVEKILSSLYASEKKPQTLLFSATLPEWVSDICTKYVSPKCKRITLVSEEESRTSDTVEHMAILCPYYERANAIADTIRVYSRGSSSRCIVFCETKKEADELAAHNAMANDCHVFHGDVPQDKREFILQKFREGKYKTLMTTNVAARGLDIPDVELVIQCAPPSTAEDYIHRSGRTGRAGRNGISICFYTMKQRHQLSYIERGAGITFKRISVPSAGDIVEVWASELSEAFAEIPETTWSTFLPAARSLVDSLVPEVPSNATPAPMKKSKKSKKAAKQEADDDAGAEEHNGSESSLIRVYERVLCCALAKIAGKMKTLENRSVLSAHAGLTAYRLNIPAHMTAHRKGLCYSLLGRYLGPAITDTIRNLALIKGRKGFVFDVPEDQNDAIDANWVNDDDGVVLEKLTEIPELEPENDEVNGASGFRFNGSPGFRGRGGGGGRGNRGFRGGRGRGSARGGNFRGGGLKRSISSPNMSQRPVKVHKFE
ncbi:unnamed protein product [Mesocestoides corti]|uniref:Uncharacterized protein n=3 Tax=Mesocestoides corti TaxID=53468 RepID=A0A0R3UL85_MESCO|nr:unnamed protein product [Mesocestoides corti]